VKEGMPEEIELVRVHGEGRIELVRRTGPPFHIVLSETTPQDLVAELGPPDAIYRKNDRRLQIHKAGRSLGGGAGASRRANSMNAQDDSETDQSSTHTTTDDSDMDEDDAGASRLGSANEECFYNYFHHGFDIFISHPTLPSTASPTSPRATSQPAQSYFPNATSASQLTATKILLHANVPGSYPFNRHRRSRWTLEHVPSSHFRDAPTSEWSFPDIAGRLREVWKSSYANEEEEKNSQRGMVLNRGWGDSPGSSCELLGGWEEQAGGVKKGNAEVDAGEQGLGNTELFGFPGLVFEVLKNGAVSCLTVF
jgi:isoleucyl-tRNA synthetase